MGREGGGEEDVCAPYRAGDWRRLVLWSISMCQTTSRVDCE